MGLRAVLAATRLFHECLDPVDDVESGTARSCHAAALQIIDHFGGGSNLLDVVDRTMPIFDKFIGCNALHAGHGEVFGMLADDFDIAPDMVGMIHKVKPLAYGPRGEGYGDGICRIGLAR